MLTFAEVLEALAKRQGTLGDLKVSDIHEHDPLTATPGLDVMELRRVMLERHARYVPVIDGPTLLGVVSFHDVAKAVLRRAELREPHAQELHQELAGRRRAVAADVVRACRSALGVRPAAGTSPAAGEVARVAPFAIAPPCGARSSRMASVRSAATQRRVAGAAAPPHGAAASPRCDRASR